MKTHHNSVKCEASAVQAYAGEPTGEPSLLAKICVCSEEAAPKPSYSSSTVSFSDFETVELKQVADGCTPASVAEAKPASSLLWTDNLSEYASKDLMCELLCRQYSDGKGNGTALNALRSPHAFPPPPNSEALNSVKNTALSKDFVLDAEEEGEVVLKAEMEWEWEKPACLTAPLPFDTNVVRPDQFF